MLVHRVTWNLKPGKQEKAMELLRNAREKHPTPHVVRVYTPEIGPFNRLVYEIEFEDFADYQAHWQERYTLPEFAEFIEKWNEFATGGDELWNLME
jgi:hypothetical protein